MDVLFEITVFGSMSESHANTIMECAFQGIGEEFWEQWSLLEAAVAGSTRHLVTFAFFGRKTLTVEVFIDRNVSTEYIETLVKDGIHRGAEALGEMLGERVANAMINTVTRAWDSTTSTFDSAVNHLADAITSARRRLFPS